MGDLVEQLARATHGERNPAALVVGSHQPRLQSSREPAQPDLAECEESDSEDGE